MKFKPEHKGADVYNSRLGRGKITLIENGIVHVQHERGRARYQAKDGDNGAGQKLHFFGAQK